MNLETREDGYWFKLHEDEYGPYETKKEAAEDFRGMKRFFRDNPELKKVSSVGTKPHVTSQEDIMSTTTTTSNPSPKKKTAAKKKSPTASTKTKKSTKAASTSTKGRKSSGKKTGEQPPTTKTKVRKRNRGTAIGVSVQDRRIALVKLLRTMKATSATSAKPVVEVAEKLGYTNHDVYCLAFHQFPLAKQGFVKTAKLPDVRGNAIYLTDKGKKTKFDAPPFVSKNGDKSGK